MGVSVRSLIKGGAVELGLCATPLLGTATSGLGFRMVHVGTPGEGL